MNAEETDKLKTLSRQPKTNQRIALRARIVLARAAGATNAMVAKRMRLTPSSQKTFELSANPFFVEKVRNIVGAKSKQYVN